MNHGLAFNTVAVILLDDRRPIGGLALLDHGRAVTVPVVIVPMTFTHRHAGANRPHSHADLIGHRRNGEGTEGCGNQQILLHDLLLKLSNSRTNGWAPEPFQWNLGGGPGFSPRQKESRPKGV